MFKSETTKKIASNTIYQLIGKCLSLAITVSATILVARVYGRQDYGEFSLMQNWPALFFVIVDFGLNAIATRDISKDWNLAKSYFGTILAVRIMVSLFFVFILSFVLQPFPYSFDLKLGIILSLFLILTQALYATSNIIFQVKMRYDLSTIAYIVGYLIILVLIVVLSILKIDVMWVSFSYVIGGLVTFFIHLHYIKKLGVDVNLKIDPVILKMLILQSLPLGLMFIFSQVNFKSDSLLLSVLNLPTRFGLNNTETIAVYSLPYKVFEVAMVLPTFFMNSVYPVMVLHMEESKQRLKDTFLKSLKFLALAGICSSVIGIIFAPLAINILGGAEFALSIIALQILLSGLTLYFLTQPISWLIVTLGRQRDLPIIYFISAIFNVSANYYFIPKYSMFASAVITHVSELIVLVGLVLVAKKAWKLKYA